MPLRVHLYWNQFKRNSKLNCLESEIVFPKDALSHENKNKKLDAYYMFRYIYLHDERNSLDKNQWMGSSIQSD